MTDGEYYEQLRACLIRFRESLGRGGQPKMANALGVTLHVYKKLETRDYFPLVLVAQLCTVTGWRIEDVVLGRFGRLTPRRTIEGEPDEPKIQPLHIGRNKKRTRA